MTIDLEKNKAELKIKPKFVVEDIAVWIKELDEYMGYLAWAEIYISKKDSKVEFGLSVLNEMVEFYPNLIFAYIRLWNILYWSWDV